MIRLRADFALVLLGAAALSAGAQGTLSTQGLGFPQGQLSTMAISMGGATGESDPYSPLNPAALSLLPASVVFSQAEPEYRVVHIGGVTQRTSLARFPVFMGALVLGPRWTLGVSASSLLDRTWATTTRDTQQIGTDTLAGALTQKSDGSMTDVRGALAYQLLPWFRVGVGMHGVSGRVLLQSSRIFDDTARFAADTQRSTVGFSGNAVSVGAEAAWARIAAIGVSFKHGGRLRAYSGDDVVGSGTVPDHIGASFLYLGLRGTTLAVRAAKDDWSHLEGMSPTLHVHEGVDVGIGGETTGPKFGGSPFSLRAGVRFRTLPFSVDDTPVKDRSVSGGVAFPLADGRVQFSFAAIRSARSGGGNASENAWTVSTGLTVRP
jgi:hypothetical protein